MEFKDKLKALRREKGISQQALADAIFVSRSAVAKWENGLGFPNEESLAALQEYFSVPAGDFSTQKPETVIVQKNKRIKRLNLQFVALILAILLAAALIIPNTKAGMKLTVLLLQSSFEDHAEALLADPANRQAYLFGKAELEHKPDRFCGFAVHIYTTTSVFYERDGIGYRGVFYSASGQPVGFQGIEMDFYPCGGHWYWAQETGDNWMHTEHITGNWYWYEMHF